MGRPQGTLLVQWEELPFLQRAARALLRSHAGSCSCAACKTGRPLLARIEDKLTTPASRPEQVLVDQGERAR